MSPSAHAIARHLSREDGSYHQTCPAAAVVDVVAPRHPKTTAGSLAGENK